MSDDTRTVATGDGGDDDRESLAGAGAVPRRRRRHHRHRVGPGRGRRRRSGPRAHRPLPPGQPDRRGRHGPGLPGRADRAHPPLRRPEGGQAGHGHRRVRGPLRVRAPGPGADGPPGHRPRLRRRHHGARPPLLRDGVRGRRPPDRVLRRAPPGPAAPPRAVRPRLRRRAARPPEGHHPPRPQAQQRADHRVRRAAGAQDHRLRRGQGRGPGPDRQHAADRSGPGRSARRPT